MKLLIILWTYFVSCYRRRFATRTEMLRWQQKQLQRHLAFLSRRSPFYRDLGPGLKLEQLPIMDKNLMMENFDRLNTRGLSRKKAMQLALEAERTRDFSSTLEGVTIGLSSGTSGNRGLFAVSPTEQAQWAGHLLAKVIPGALLGHRHRAALFLRANSNLYETTGRARIKFKFFDLLHTMEQHADALNNFQPSILVAPPSLLRQLAQRQIQGTIKIAPQRIYAAAEVLEDLDAAFIGQAFGQVIHQIYQATEGFLGISCREGHLHLNEDVVFIEKEFVDAERKRFVPIITDFRRRVQPIVRYRLNDILCLDESPCPCGSVFTRLSAIEGRCDDMLAFLNLDGKPQEVFPDFVRRAVISADENILEYRVRQQRVDQLTIELRLSAPAEAANCQQRIHVQLAAFCSEQKMQMPELHFAPYRFEAGLVKLRRIMNEMPRHPPTLPPGPSVRVLELSQTPRKEGSL